MCPVDHTTLLYAALLPCCMATATLWKEVHERAHLRHLVTSGNIFRPLLSCFLKHYISTNVCPVKIGICCLQAGTIYTWAQAWLCSCAVYAHELEQDTLHLSLLVPWLTLNGEMAALGLLEIHGTLLEQCMCIVAAQCAAVSKAYVICWVSLASSKRDRPSPRPCAKLRRQGKCWGSSQVYREGVP